MTEPAGWRSYLAAFHRERAGVTEDILERAVDDTGRTAYDWTAQAVPAQVRVLDLACGSGPMRSRLAPAGYLGVDLSPAELGLAAARSLPVARADAACLPLPDGAVDVVGVSMALMLLPLEATLAEIRRVLVPGGLLVATVPGSRPLRPVDRLHWARLCVALRRRGLSYPNDAPLSNAAAAFRSAGLVLRGEQSRAFVYPVSTEHSADRLLASLYLPDVDDRRMAHASRVVRGWVGRGVALPIRRLLASRPAAR